MWSAKRFCIPFLLCVWACASTDLPIPQAWLSSPTVHHIGAFELAADGTVQAAAATPKLVEIRIEKRADGEVLVRGDRPLTPAYAAIQSFDVSEDRREVAFSAKRKDNFDIGLVSLDGSDVHWIPEEPIDETDPHWARRGNKFSYILRSANGDLVRTIHVPTSVQLTVDFPTAVINGLAWDAASERFAVAYETPDAAEQIDVMKYSGEERRHAVEPAVRLKYTVEPFATDALILRPAEMRYQERLPLVVWLTTGRLNEWNDSRGALLNATRAGCIITTRVPDAAFWQSAAQIPWIDPAKTYVVDAAGRVAAAPPKATLIRGGAVNRGFYRQSGGVLMVAGGDVESVAAGYIAGKLKIEN